MVKYVNEINTCELFNSSLLNTLSSTSGMKHLPTNTREIQARKIVALVQRVMREDHFKKTILVEEPRCIGAEIGDLQGALAPRVQVYPDDWRASIDIWLRSGNRSAKVFSAAVEPFHLSTFKRGDWIQLLERSVNARMN